MDLRNLSQAAVVVGHGAHTGARHISLEAEAGNLLVVEFVCHSLGRSYGRSSHPEEVDARANARGNLADSSHEGAGHADHSHHPVHIDPEEEIVVGSFVGRVAHPGPDVVLVSGKDHWAHKKSGVRTYISSAVNNSTFECLAV